MSTSGPPLAFAPALRAGTREHYEDADLYDHEYRRRRLDVAWYRELARKLAAQLPGAGEPGRSSLRILELGCGSGRLLVPLLRDGHTLWGVDRAAPMLRRCLQRLSRVNARTRARVHILQGDFRCLPIASAARAAESAAENLESSSGFPLIVCPFNGFQHLYTRQDVERCLAEVRRLLAPGGLFAFDITHPDPQWLARDPTRRYDRRRFRHPATGERLIYSTSHAYDPATQLDWIRLYYEPDPAHSPSENGEHCAQRTAPRGPPRMVTLVHRLFFPAEIEALLHYAGFKIVHHAGGFEDELSGALDGAPLSIVSEEQVICASVR
jgi:SAM-dependent methyltransferase